MKLRRTPAPWTLRRRLVVSVVALFALISIAIAGISIGLLSNNLEGRINDQLQRISNFTGGSRFDQGTPGEVNILNTPGLQPGAIVGYSLNGTSASMVVKPTAIGGSTKQLTSDEASAIIAGSLTKHPTTVSVPDLGSFQFVRIPVTATNADAIYYGLPLAETQSELTRFGLEIAGISLLGIVLIAFATWFIVSYALRPLRRVAATATEVASMPLDRGEVDLSVRVPDADTDRRTEVGQVGLALNTMLGHVDNALKARQASESRVRQFVADASHELRTPLASIRGYAELTRRGNYDLPKDVTHSLGRVESEAVRMTSLVEDLLLLARLDAGRDIETAPVDLSRLLVDCVSDAHVAGSDHEFALDLPDDPVMVEGDAQRIHQVFANLLANARVHTPAGTQVTVALEKPAAGGAVVTVSDDGPGIPAELQDDLFERFARGDSSRARATGSTGLGLAIVRAVVDAHDGSVSFESSEAGTTFRVELPGVSANP